ncbi:helix-hairpin-helix domain-containing protein [Streptomyces sp. NPDC056672]|uniref:helix-hairpin-helix domain-containing protein n=1 Tax=Streptomyces sp. NPDC056672 TaxID=3345906 RepID=UPI00369D22F5
MTLRTRSVTSGPGRAPGSDVRARHPRRRADALFAGPPVGAAVGPPVGAADPPPVLLAGGDDEGGRARDGRREREGRRERVGLALRERLPMWLQLRCGLQPRTLAALAVVLVVAALLAAQHFWAGRPRSVRAPETVGAAGAVMPSMASGVPGAPAPVETSRVVVDVGGEVRKPGVLRLPTGSRVADALRAAGGVKPDADITGLNRARVLMDGEQVVVGGPAPPGAEGGGVGTGGGMGAGQGGAGVGAGGGTGVPVPVSLNSATVEQLDTLPGVGPVLARHIIDYRTEHGGFRSVGELREVNGIGARRFADLQPLVRP